MGAERFLRVIVLSASLTLLFSCDPFTLSLFPAYLTDLDAHADLRGLFTGGGVEHIEFFVLNAGSDEYVFVTKVLYTGLTTTYVFGANLDQIGTIPNAGGGSRHFIDVSGNLIIGDSRFLGLPDFGYIAAMPSGYWAPHGGLLMRSGNPTNSLISSGGQVLNIDFFSSPSWGLIDSSPVTIDADPAHTGYSYELRSVRRLHSVPWFGGDDVTVLIFGANLPDGSHPGYAFVLNDGAYTDITSFTSLFNSPGVLYLGEIDWEGGYATREGVIAQGRDGAVRLIGWDNRVIAMTRAVGGKQKVLIDYGEGDYYYIFDPSTYRLFKARNWWHK